MNIPFLYTLLAPRPTTPPMQRTYVSSGSVLLNLALTGTTTRGFQTGKYYRLVGDSGSGKTFLSLTCMAEASMRKEFDSYDLTYDDAEDGVGFDFKKFFGPKMASRVSPPKQDGSNSTTVEEFYDNFFRRVESGKPCIYVMDSMDVLDTIADARKLKKTRASREKGTDDVTGSYGTAKAKLNSEMLRRAVEPLRRTGSILIIISQTRDAIGGFNPFGPQKTTGGGHALKFYANQEIWMSLAGDIKKLVKGKQRKIGVNVKIRVKKNRQTGQDRTTTVPIYYSFGIDDVGSCIDYLIEEGHWKKKQGGLYAPEFEFSGPKEKLIQSIEDSNKEKTLAKIVKGVYNTIEEATQLKRKTKYV